MSKNGDFDIQKSHINGVGIPVVTAGASNNGILGKSDINAKILPKNTLTVDMFGLPIFRNHSYKLVTHARVFTLIRKDDALSDYQGLFFSSSLKYLQNCFGYNIMCSWSKIKDMNIHIPLNKEGSIDFYFINHFMQQIESSRVAKVKQYLKDNDLLTTNLNKDEKIALASIETKPTKMFNLKSLFGASTRGKRLKSKDRVLGSLPFVTAGEAEHGVSAFISNDVTIFDKNTITIDMFGSAKYRNYDYGCDDHVAVVHTQDLSKQSVIFVTTAIHKTSYNGQFNYGRNFYAKDADELNILLPVQDGKPDYEFMETYISAVQKLTVKSLISYLSEKNF